MSGTTALLTIDIQNDTLDDQPFGVAGTYDIIPNVSRLTRLFRRKGLPTIHVVRIYRKDGSNVDLCRKEAFCKGAKILVEDSDGSQIVPDLLPDASVRLDSRLLLSNGIQKISTREWIIFKPRWGAFYQTPLHRMLEEMAVDTLVITGCNFPNCPRTTIYEASERDYRTIAVSDAISGIYERGLQELRAIGVVTVGTDELVAHFERG